MSVSRPVLSSLRNQSAQPLNQLVKRFGHSRRFHCSNHMTSARVRHNTPLVPKETPTSWSWRRYIIPAALIGGIGGAVVLVHHNDERRAIQKGSERSRLNTANGPIIGGPFTLIDTESRVVTERDILGKWILLYFGYTSSPDIGPAEVQKMANAIDSLESKQNLKILPIFVTIDPQHDTPSQLRSYLKEFDSRIVGLTGPVSAIRQMAQEYRVYFRKVDEEGNDYLVQSSHNMYLINPNMEIVSCFGVEYSPEDLTEAIAKEMKRSVK